MRALVVAVALVAACQRTPSVAVGAGEVVTDALGRAVRVPRPLARVVSLAPSSTEILFALGAGPKVVGVDRYSDFPAAARALPHVGADVDPSLERVVALRPDVVFTATSANTQRTVEALERLGIPVYVSRADGLDPIYRDVEGIARAIGDPAAGARVVTALRARITAVHARVATLPPVRALVVVGTDPLVVAGNATHIADLLRAAGGVNVAGDSPQPFPTYSVERLLARAPEVIIVGTYPTDPAPPLGPLEKLDALPAVRNHRLHTVDGDLIFRPGPRVAEGVAAIARLLHPDGFK